MGTIQDNLMKYVSPGGRLGTALKILAGIVRWSWRLCSIALTLFGLVFLLAGLSQGIHISRDPSDLAHIVAVLILFAGMVVAWWREGLGGLISLLGCFIFAGITTIVNWHNGIRAGALVAAGLEDLGPVVLPLLMLFSWALHTLNDSTATPRNRRLGLIAATVFTVAIAFCVRGMFPVRFNP